MHKRDRFLTLCCVGGALLVMSPMAKRIRAPQQTDLPTEHLEVPSRALQPPRPNVQLLTIPLSFDRNEGQFPDEVRFAARGSGIALALRTSDFLVSLMNRYPTNDANSGSITESRLE
jgi:hypothetical protein